MTVPANLIEKLRESPTVYQEGVWVDLAVDELFKAYDQALIDLKAAEDSLDAIAANTGFHIAHERKT